ncbi:permease for cytosine/purines, uracil, thiamine, allantoin-domain-containing protein [Diplogelasinospora grovesii]|uniref:Permease for cytosine/purines, uracil, thiamine, allantoin-domain-containing protein n=1 Tax=Diplogelasinospora grovesii TaxID=303347 RepID=A0AAN6MZU4_9PEZI|nr:permease for cytosine/purines, uracil, thiamine, allantoin-domain-containing protein [Diplogelasinospora grovesii]
MLSHDSERRPPVSSNQTRTGHVLLDDLEARRSGTETVKKTATGLVDELSEVEASKGWFAAFVKCSSGAGTEERGIERVKEENRAKQSVMDGFTMWASANLTPVTLAAGTLGPGFGLGFWDTFAVIVVVNFFIAAVVGYFGCFGPATGLRMLSVARFTFGVWGTRALLVLSTCGVMGWASVNSIAGALILTELSDGRCPLWAGNLIIGVCTAIISFFGYFAIHWFERICWVPMVVVFIFLAAYGSEHFDAAALPAQPGPSQAAGVMSFIAVTFGFIAGWASMAADYHVRMPVNTNKFKLTASIWAGNFIGIVIPELLGAALMTAVAKDPGFADAFRDHGIGGLMGQTLQPLGGFGKFLLALAALSIIGCNLANNYSLAFEFQNFHPLLLKVPRPVYSVLGSAAIIAIAIAAENSFVEVLISFLSVTSYYTTPFICCVLVDFLYFRKGKYPLESWNDTNKLPYGIAGFAAIALAFVGAVLSMNQTWLVGVIARASGPAGAELGWIFSGIFSVLAYVPLRHLELRYTGR